MSEKLYRTQLDVQEHMDAILTNFIPDAKITVAVRFPGNDDADFVMTSDNLADVGKMLTRRQATDPGSEPLFPMQPAALAIAAASQASEAVTELLRFAREGEGLNGAFEIEVVEKLLDATKMAIEAMGEAGKDHAEIHQHIATAIEGWI